MARKKVLYINQSSTDNSLPSIYEGWHPTFVKLSSDEDLNKIFNNTYQAICLKIHANSINNSLFQNINSALSTDGFAHIITSTIDSSINENDLINLLLEQNFYQIYNGIENTDIIVFAFKNKPTTQQLLTLGLETSNNKPPYLPTYTKPEADRVNNFFCPVFWGVENPQKVADSIQEISKHAISGFHFADNFFTWFRNMSMFDDKPFVKAWENNAESASDQAIVWRRYVLACAAYHCVQLEGDFVECGAYTGVGMKTIIDYLGGVNFPKMFWGYDLFEHNDSMLNHAMPEHGTDLYERVQEKFIHYPQVEIIKGFIPDCFEDNCPEKIAYLHIDLNQAPAEIAALEHLFDRVVPGGIIILDDYEWSGIYRPQKLAEDEWFEQRNYKVMPLPTGQGLVFKR